MNRFEALLKYSAKRPIWACRSRRRRSELANFFLFTSRRSGGTWLSEIISAHSGIASVIQPISRGFNDPYLRWKGLLSSEVEANARIPVRSRDESWMSSFVEAILDGEVAVEEPWQFWRNDYERVTTRSCLKIHNAKGWIEWFDRQWPDAHIIFHLRHPIPQSLSTMSRGWDLLTEHYLNDDWFVERYLTPSLMELIADVHRRGSRLEKYVVNWCVENLAPLRAAERHSDWLVTTYEELTISSEEMVDHLESELDLAPDRAALQQATTASGTVVDRDTREIIEGRRHDGDTAWQYLLRRWEGQVDREMIDAVGEILDAFDIDVYGTDFAPSRRYLNLPVSETRLEDILPPGR